MQHFSLMNVEIQSSWLGNFSLNFWTSKLLHSADSWQNVVVMFVVSRTKMGNRQKLPASTDLVPSLTIRQCCSSVSLGQVKRTKWKMMASISFIMRLALQWPVTRNTPNIFFFMFIGHCLIVVVVATGIFFWRNFFPIRLLPPKKLESYNLAEAWKRDYSGRADDCWHSWMTSRSKSFSQPLNAAL